MSDTTAFPAKPGGYHFEVCPFLGLEQDLQTSTSFPSAGNFCHRTRPYGTPNLDYQRSFCFSQNHSNCPIYTRSGRAPIPADIRFKPDKPFFGRQVILPWLIGMLVLLGLLGGLWAIKDLVNHGGSLFGKLGSGLPSSTPDNLQTAPIPSMDTTVPPTVEPATPAPLFLTPLPASTTPTPTPQTPTDTLTFTPTPSRTFHFIPSFTPTRTFIIFENTPVPPTEAPTTVQLPTDVPTAAPLPTATS
jgi:hypothetical protein